MYTATRIERRKYDRFSVALSAIFRIEAPDFVKKILQEQELEAETTDLSEAGLSLVTDQYLPLHTKLFMKLVVFESEHKMETHFFEPLTIRGEVRSNTVSGESTYRLGVAFKQMDEKNRCRLFDICHSSLRPQTV